MSRFPMKEWQCVHCDLDIFCDVGKPKFTCNLKNNFLMTKEEMLIVFNNWIVNQRYAINGKKAFFADWFKKALEYIGAPKELIEYPTSICETNMSGIEIYELYKKVLPTWKKFYTKEMKKIKKENEVRK